MKEHMANILLLRCQTQHSILSLPSSKSPSHDLEASLLETCRISLLLYSSMVVFPVPEISGVPIRLSRLLQPVLADCFENAERKLHGRFLLWATTLGMISAPQSERAWFLDTLVLLKDFVRVGDWKGFKGIMGDFLWLDGVCDGPAERVWRELCEVEE